MKKIILFLLLNILSLGSRAQLLTELPDSYCDPAYYNCSQASRELAAAYFAAPQPKLNSDEALFSGECHMISSMFDGNHAHHGYIYLRKQNAAFGFFGQFAYFYDEDPYRDLSIEKARELHAAPSKYEVMEKELHWQVDTNIDPPWQYFLRQSGNDLLLVGLWGIDDSVTCRLTKH